jgi:hypothetical protein
MSREKVKHILAEMRDHIDMLGDKKLDPKKNWKEVTELLARFLMGFTMIPKNVMQNPSAFWSVDTIDCSTAYTGVLCLRVAKDANDSVHPKSISVIFAPEGKVALRAVMKAEKLILSALPGPKVAEFGNVLTVHDAAKCLRTERKLEYPSSWTMYCAMHMRNAMTRGNATKEEKAIYNTCLNLPKHCKEIALRKIANLPKTSMLHRYDKAELWPCFFPDGWGNHGTTVNQTVEVAHQIYSSVRTARSLFQGMVAAEEVTRNRNISLQEKLLRAKSAALGRKEVTWEEAWPVTQTSWIPNVKKELEELIAEARQYQDPKKMCICASPFLVSHHFL